MSFDYTKKFIMGGGYGRTSRDEFQNPRLLKDMEAHSILSWTPICDYQYIDDEPHTVVYKGQFYSSRRPSGPTFSLGPVAPDDPIHGEMHWRVFSGGLGGANALDPDWFEVDEDGKLSLKGVAKEEDLKRHVNDLENPHKTDLQDTIDQTIANSPLSINLKGVEIFTKSDFLPEQKLITAGEVTAQLGFDNTVHNQNIYTNGNQIFQNTPANATGTDKLATIGEVMNAVESIYMGQLRFGTDTVVSMNTLINPETLVVGDYCFSYDTQTLYQWDGTTFLIAANQPIEHVGAYYDIVFWYGSYGFS